MILAAILLGSIALAPQSANSSDLPEAVAKNLQANQVAKHMSLSSHGRETAVHALRKLQTTATGSNRIKLAYMLADLGDRYPENRDVLLESLKACGSEQNADKCGDAPVYVEQLYRSGHHELLQALFRARDAYNAAAQESLGAFYGELLRDHPADFLNGIDSFSIRDQKSICQAAARDDGGGISRDDLRRVTEKLEGNPSAVAQRCLATVKLAGK